MIGIGIGIGVCRGRGGGGAAPPEPDVVTSYPAGNPAGQTPYVHAYDATYDYELIDIGADTPSVFPASVVKLMTVYGMWLFHSADWTTGTVTMTPANVAQPIPGLTLDLVGFEAGDEPTWQQMAYAILLPSDCASCQQAAEDIGDEIYAAAGNTGLQGIPRFVEWMNETADTLGLTASVFTDPYGGSRTFDPTTDRNVMSARDMSKLCLAVMAIPTLQAIAATPSYDIVLDADHSPNPRTIAAANYNAFVNGPLFDRAGISDSNVVGGKNGVWDLGGFFNHNLTQIVTTPAGQRVVITVLQSQSAWAQILDYKGVMYGLPRLFDYMNAVASPDPQYANVRLLVGADGEIVDEKNATAVVVTSVTVGDPVVASEGGAVFDAAADVVAFSGAVALNRVGSGYMTAEAWYAGPGAAPANPTEYVVFGKFAAGAVEWTWNYLNNLIQIFASADGTAVTNGIALNVSEWLPTSNVLFNGAPRHFALVKDAAGFALYINGERCPGTLAMPTVYAGATPVTIGLAGASAVGRVDEFRLTIAAAAGAARYTADMVTITPVMFPRS